MRYRPTILSISLALVVAGVFGIASQMPAGPFAKTAVLDAAALSKQLASSVERGDTPGVVALVVDRTGVLYEGSAGKLDGGRNIPMPVNAIFNIASMTKPVTSVAIMMLL